MGFAELILIYTLTVISIVITIKGAKTAFLEIMKLSHWVVLKLKATLNMVRGVPHVSSTNTFGKLIERSKSTLLPFINRSYVKQVKRRQYIGFGYLLVFLFGFFMITTFFWAFLTADLSTVVEQSPYLLDSFESLLINYELISKTISILFILGFIIELINSIRSFMS